MAAATGDLDLTVSGIDDQGRCPVVDVLVTVEDDASPVVVDDVAELAFVDRLHSVGLRVSPSLSGSRNGPAHSGHRLSVQSEPSSWLLPNDSGSCSSAPSV